MSLDQERREGVLAAPLQFRAAPVEVRAEHGIAGYGAVAEQSTLIEGMFDEWDEVMARGAWTKTLNESTRIMSMFNHDPNRLLGSTDAGTLRLAEDEGGLRYDVDINDNDPLAVSVRAQVERGDVHGSSVWFQVMAEQWTQPDADNGLERPLRTITEARLFEVGPVTWPAYEQTTAAARSAVSLEAALTDAGVESRSKRASLAYRMLTEPVAAADELRRLLDRNPELRRAACSCEVVDDQRAADEALEDSTPPHPRHVDDVALSVARARLSLMSRQ